MKNRLQTKKYTLRWTATLLVPAAMLGLLWPTTGCGRKPGDDPTEAALVPNASFVARIDVRGAAATPIGKTLQELRKQKRSTVPIPAAQKQLIEDLKKESGLTDEDIRRVVMSADISQLDLDSGKSPDPETLNIAISVGLLKSITADTFKKCARLIIDQAKLRPVAEAVNTPTLTEDSLDGHPVLILKSSKPDEPSLHLALSKKGKTVYITLNRSSMSGLLKRADNGRSAGLSAGLSKLDSSLPKGTHSRFLLQVPESFQNKMKKKFSNPGTGGGAMLTGMIAPFMNMKNLSISARYGTSLEILLTSDLGTPENALQLNGMLAMFKGMLAQKDGGRSAGAVQKLKSETDGSILRIEVVLDESDISALAKPAR